MGATLSEAAIIIVIGGAGMGEQPFDPHRSIQLRLDRQVVERHVFIRLRLHCGGHYPPSHSRTPPAPSSPAPTPLPVSIGLIIEGIDRAQCQRHVPKAAPDDLPQIGPEAETETAVTDSPHLEECSCPRPRRKSRLLRTAPCSIRESPPPGTLQESASPSSSQTGSPPSATYRPTRAYRGARSRTTLMALVQRCPASTLSSNTRQ